MLKKGWVRKQLDLYHADIAAFDGDWRNPQICKPRNAPFKSLASSLYVAVVALLCAGLC